MLYAFLIQVVVPLVVAGIVLWGLGQLTPPIDATLSKIARVVVIVVVAIWVLYAVVALLGGLPPIVPYRR